ncbi:MAG: hypothetical protein HQL70_09600 [Magnetococcales bacterium]|nr:hypothetical protein [Magnetococcales bacterium]
MSENNSSEESGVNPEAIDEWPEMPDPNPVLSSRLVGEILRLDHLLDRAVQTERMQDVREAKTQSKSVVSAIQFQLGS